jgi:hypothetical protein
MALIIMHIGSRNLSEETQNPAALTSSVSFAKTESNEAASSSRNQDTCRSEFSDAVYIGTLPSTMFPIEKSSSAPSPAATFPLAPSAAEFPSALAPFSPFMFPAAPSFPGSLYSFPASPHHLNSSYQTDFGRAPIKYLIHLSLLE